MYDKGMKIPVDKEGNRITIGKINSAFWIGYDGGLMPNRAEKDSMVAKAWYNGKSCRRVEEC